MKCANPNCNRGIGLVCHQRHSFDKLRFCSKKCRDEFVDEKPKRLRQELHSTSYFEWLLSRPTANLRGQANLLGTRIRGTLEFCEPNLFDGTLVPQLETRQPL
jgi:hypothetical protein